MEERTNKTNNSKELLVNNLKPKGSKSAIYSYQPGQNIKFELGV